LLCGGITGQEGTRWILRKWGIALDGVREIRYRTGGWPGAMLVSFKSARRDVVIPLGDYSVQFFACWRPWRCLLCMDRTSALADISLGDAWLPELRKQDGIGSSLIIVRTSKGLDVFQDALASGVLKAREIDRPTLLRSQSSLFRNMNTTVKEVYHLARLLRRRVPDYGVSVDHPGLANVIRRARLLLRYSIHRRMSQSDRVFAMVHGIALARTRLLQWVGLKRK
jgi:coenzyme F420 hydrogenase subunit beta